MASHRQSIQPTQAEISPEANTSEVMITQIDLSNLGSGDFLRLPDILSPAIPYMFESGQSSPVDPNGGAHKNGAITPNVASIPDLSLPSDFRVFSTPLQAPRLQSELFPSRRKPLTVEDVLTSPHKAVLFQSLCGPDLPADGNEVRSFLNAPGGDVSGASHSVKASVSNTPTFNTTGGNDHGDSMHHTVCDEQWNRAKRRRRTYMNCTPSRYCHICAQIPRPNQGRAPCMLARTGRCRKLFCERCLRRFGWDFEEIERNLDSWLCPHCEEVCPKVSQCHIYNRVNSKREGRKLKRDLTDAVVGSQL